MIIPGRWLRGGGAACGRAGIHKGRATDDDELEEADDDDDDEAPESGNEADSSFHRCNDESVQRPESSEPHWLMGAASAGVIHERVDGASIRWFCCWHTV